MKRRLLTTSLLAISAVALLSGFTRCGHRGAPNPERVQRHMTEHVDDFIDDIDADKSQATQIKALAQRVIVQVPTAMQGHSQMKDTLHKQWASAQPDRAALHNQLDGQLKVLNGILHDMVDAMVDLHAVLTPEQRAEVADRH